ncbi:uncharacterized protein LOC121391488 [Gigantopelta aegis]|uniref:uncharacterized protein LOC121391488 n=1 Tax=Gigantopelta aegis TaxID=1735272 RepID=UPI001B88C14F|nr:uncharacterized protein LOC121391488 [Gigantopelta aegis]
MEQLPTTPTRGIFPHRYDRQRGSFDINSVESHTGALSTMLTMEHDGVYQQAYVGGRLHTPSDPRHAAQGVRAALRGHRQQGTQSLESACPEIGKRGSRKAPRLLRCPVRSRRPLKIRRRLVILVPGRTHIRSRSPRLTASSRCNNVGKGSRQIGSVTSGQGLALRAGPVGLEYEAGLGRARAGRGLPLSLVASSLSALGSLSPGCSWRVGVRRVRARRVPLVGFRPGPGAFRRGGLGARPLGGGVSGSSSDRCFNLPVDCLSYAAAPRASSVSAGIQQPTQNWYGPGESDCLIKTKHCDGRHPVLTQCDFCPVL